MFHAFDVDVQDIEMNTYIVVGKIRHVSIGNYIIVHSVLMHVNLSMHGVHYRHVEISLCVVAYRNI